jgi:hypothetical protein
VVRVELTRRGAVVAADAPEAAQGRLLHALARMPADEVGTIRDVVHRLVHAMEAADVEARFFFSDEA